MFNLGGWEIAMLVIAGLLLFGPNKLPQIMRQAGKIMREIKKASAEFQYSIERELEDDKYARQHRREKKRRKKMIEAGLDPDAPQAGAPAPVASAPIAPTAAPDGTIPVKTPAPAAAESSNSILPPASAAADAEPASKTKTGS